LSEAFRPPPGATDCHAHLFGPPERYPYVTERSYTPETRTDDEYAAMLAEIGFTRGVLVQPSVHGEDNGAMLAAIARHPATYRGVAIVSPGKSAAELAALHAGGVRGVRVQTAVAGGIPLAQLERLAAQTNEFGWHVVLHLDRAAELLDIAPVLERIRNPFVLDHIARIRPSEGIDSPQFQLVLRLLEGGRCYVKIASFLRLSAEPYPFRDYLPMVSAVVSARPDRIIWGTAWPHPSGGDPVALIPQWAPDAADQRRMLVENPARLYGFPEG
jgi:predicted TIM-barrel fold metal-dependent hydrolase